MLKIAGIILLSTLLSFVITSYGQHVVQSTAFLNIRNYGCIMQPIRTFVPVSDSWLHTYALNLTTLTGLPTMKPVNCTALLNPDHVETCRRLWPLIVNIQDMDRKALNELRKLVDHTMDILHDTLPSTDARKRRGFLDFVGGISRSLFGTAMDSDVLKNRDMIEQLRKLAVSSSNSVSVQADKLSSYMELSNDRFSKLTNLINYQQQELSTLVMHYQHQFVDSQASHLNLARGISRAVDFSVHLEHINSLEQAILFASHGFLTPELLPAKTIAETLTTLQTSLRDIHSPFYLVRKVPEDVYTSRDFHIWMENKVMYITLRFPFTPFRNPLTIYEIRTVPAPLPMQPEHFTRILELPKFVAFHPDEDLFLSLDELPHIPESNLLNLQQMTHLLLNRSTPSCLAALLTRNSPRIASLCKFEFQANNIQPTVLHVDSTRLLLIHIPHYVLRCGNGTENRFTPPPYVEIEVPCSCSFVSEYGMFAGKTMSCDTNSSTSPTYTYPVNLPVLKAFFEDADIGHLTTTDDLDTPLPVIMPNLSLYQHKYARELANIKQDSLRLENVVNQTKTGAKIFRSTTDQLLFDLASTNLPIESSSLTLHSWQNLLLLASSIAVTLLAFFVYLLFGRVRALSLVVGLATRTPLTMAAPVTQTPLNYFLGIPSTTETPPLIPFTFDYRLPTLDMVLLFLLVIAIGFLGVQWYKHYIAIQDSFQIFIEFGTPHVRVLIPLMTLPHVPEMYVIDVTQTLENILLTGVFMPELQITWPGVTINNRFSTLVFPLPRVIRLSWRQAHLLRQITQTSYYSLLFVYDARKLTPLKQPTHLNTAQADGSGTRPLYPPLPPYCSSTAKTEMATTSRGL